MQNLVSIIIPTFNRAHSLVKAIDSVLSQTYQSWELIIVDNSSSDDTISVINNYRHEKIKIINVENNGVIAYSRNVGLSIAQGKYVAFLDSDDWWEDLKLEKALHSIDKHNADIVYHNCNLVSLSSKSITRCRHLKTNALTDLVLNGNTLVTSSVVALREKIEKVGRFDENPEIIGWEDYHLWLKLAKNSSIFYKVNETLGSCWEGEDNFDNPKRILINLSRIQEFFVNELSGIVDLTNVWWISYTTGKAYLNQGSTLKARKCFKEVLFNGSPVSYKLKSLYYLLSKAR